MLYKEIFKNEINLNLVWLSAHFTLAFKLKRIEMGYCWLSIQ